MEAGRSPKTERTEAADGGRRGRSVGRSDGRARAILERMSGCAKGGRSLARAHKRRAGGERIERPEEGRKSIFSSVEKARRRTEL